MNTALMHFTWQGALIACCLAVALIFLRSARARYACACAALVTMPLVFAATYAWSQSQTMDEPRMRGPLFFAVPLPVTSASAPVDRVTSPDPKSLWMLGVAILYGYRFVGWLAAQRLRRRGVCAAPHEWQDRVAKLSARIRNTRPVLLLESSLAQTPITIGAWRPVILLPLGLLAGLPSAQVEAILLHELAHIRRHDYLVNLLQAAVEGLLFYHPAVWWVSHVIRREREMCCDDLAVAAVGDPLLYTRALTALEEHRVRVPILAVTGGPLMVRIQRLLGQPSSLSPTPALLFLALAASAALYAFEPAPVPMPAPIPAPAPEPGPHPSPSPAPDPQPQAPAPAASLRSEAEARAAACAKVYTPVFCERSEAMLESIRRTPYTQWLKEDAAWIVSAEERAAFERLQTDEERDMFIQQFWLRRDPTPDTPVNELREEHYRRIAWANQRFEQPGSPGWMTDRGRIYIRFGPPDEKEEHPADPSRYASEKWRYRYLEGVGTDVVVGFVDELNTGVFRMSWDQKVSDAIQSEQGRAGVIEFELNRRLSDFDMRRRLDR